MQVIADMIPMGTSAADIGTDHGLIPIYLKQIGSTGKIVLSDIADGPLEKAKENIVKFGVELSESFALRKGSGLEPVGNSEVDSIIIAGMGGELIASILEKDIAKTKSFKNLILQPRTMSDKLRHWLQDNGFYVVEEHIVLEGPAYSQIIRAVPAEMLEGRAFQIYNEELDYEIAPLLFKLKDNCLKDFLERYISHSVGVINSLNESNSADNTARLREWNLRLEGLRKRYTTL